MTGTTRNTLRDISQALIREGDSFALSSCGPSQIDFPLTIYRSFLAPALRKVAGNGLLVTDMLSAEDLREVRYRAARAREAGRAAIRRLVEHRRIDNSPQAFLYAIDGDYVLGAATVTELTRLAERQGVEAFVIDINDDDLPGAVARINAAMGR